MVVFWAADLKKCMLTVFSQFGSILDVVALKTYRLRGQAWVVFADVASATEAIRVMQNFPILDKPMVRCWRASNVWHLGVIGRCIII